MGQIAVDSCKKPDRFWLIAAVLVALGLGFANLGAPSLWHDELVHVFVGKSIAETGAPRLPSGQIYVSGTIYNYLLGGFIALFGDSEAVVRSPSVLIAALNVVLTYFAVRPLLGRTAALMAAFALALSPWSVAWSRQARFYELQQTFYLLTMIAAWRAITAEPARQALAPALIALAAFGLGCLTSLHSVIFLAPVALYALAMFAAERRLRSRWTLICGGSLALGLGVMAVYAVSLPKADWDAIFKEARLGGIFSAEPRGASGPDALYYFRWLWLNLSWGYFILAVLGAIMAAVKEGRRGLFIALAFWGPIVALNLLVDYRKERFMFFAFPFYGALFGYALGHLARFVIDARPSWGRMAMAGLIALFGARLSWTTVKLVGDSIKTASGADITLAVRHPRWRAACQYVRERRQDAAVLTVSYLPALYYVGHVDDWYPSRIIVWEFVESGLEGLKTLDDLKAFMAKHPKGYFISWFQRFERWPQFAEDVAWVRENMEIAGEISTEEITVYRWGF